MLQLFLGTLYFLCNALNCSPSILTIKVLLAIDASLLLFKGFPIASLTDICWEIFYRNAFAASSSSAWGVFLLLELQSNLISSSIFSGSEAILPSAPPPYGLVSHFQSKNSSLTCLWFYGHSTKVLVPEEPCTDGHLTDVLAAHVPSCRYSTKVLALFSVGESTSLTVTTYSLCSLSLMFRQL